MGDLTDVWNRQAMFAVPLESSSFPRNQLGPSYAPYSPQQLTGTTTSTTISNEYIANLFSNKYFLNLLGEFIQQNNLSLETFQQQPPPQNNNTNTTISSIMNSPLSEWIFRGLILFMLIILLIKSK